jgi:hypothetical protein
MAASIPSAMRFISYRRVDIPMGLQYLGRSFVP